MAQHSFIEATWLPFFPGYSWAGLLVWLLLVLGLIGFLVSLFKGVKKPFGHKE
jgi:hypothetical protein